MSSTQTTPSRALSVTLSTCVVPAPATTTLPPQSGDKRLPGPSSTGNGHPHIQEANGTIAKAEHPSGLAAAVANTSDGLEKDPDTTESVATPPNDFPYKWKVVCERVAFVAGALATISEVSSLPSIGSRFRLM